MAILHRDVHLDGAPPSAPAFPSDHSSASALTRRSLLRGGAALAAATLSSLPPVARAAGRVPFGAAMQSDLMQSDPAYRQAFLDHCDLILPMNELKWDALRPSREEFSFWGADQIIDLARANGRRSRGHCFVWWNALPDWVEAIDTGLEAERVLVDHIEQVAGRYAGTLTSWDVANEVIANDPTGEPMRDTFWMRRLGIDHIAIAFRAAAAADPHARLVLNDYDLEFTGPEHDAKRAVMMDLVRRLQDHNLRVDAVGLQGHLYAEQRVDVDAVAAFGRELQRLGVGLLVTELDVIDWKIRGGPAEQDAAAGRVIGDLMDAVFAAQRPEAVITWGITDRYTWIPDAMPRPDGTPSRPLPLDARLRPKPWFERLQRRLRTAL
ncbi:endo-1,4-beta-xylanase [Mangrovibrevibacter kandeliae]|uniref:endo-1,4-beta-xylanase n=1 Tax=Mangrovibrevibacter kandeliae TaxID=2968473 RepID=UPI00355768AB